MKRILLIDDNVHDFSILLVKLREYDVEIHWTTNIYHGKLYLESIMNFDLVICDIMGVGYSTEKDLAFLDNNKTIMTSGSVYLNIANGFNFCQKDELAKIVIEKLELNK